MHLINSLLVTWEDQLLFAVKRRSKHKKSLCPVQLENSTLIQIWSLEWWVIKLSGLTSAQNQHLLRLIKLLKKMLSTALQVWIKVYSSKELSNNALVKNHAPLISLVLSTHHYNIVEIMPSSTSNSHASSQKKIPSKEQSSVS